MLAIQNLTDSTAVFSREARLMGNHFIISVVAKDPVWATDRLNSAINEINRVEKLLSSFTDDSQINQINRSAGVKPVYVNAELFRLIDRSLQISDLTYGTFDITYSTAALSAPNNNRGVKKPVYNNYKGLVLDKNKQTVFLKNKQMRIGFGAISSGYAADRAKYILQMEGVAGGVINAGGDLLTWGLQPDNKPWTIAAADPEQAEKPYADLNISNMAVATSCNNENYLSIPANIKPAGFIDPQSGFPVSKIKSVSIITAGAELADALATPIIAMGVNAGLYMINKLNQIACIIVDDHARVYTSKGIHSLA